MLINNICSIKNHHLQLHMVQVKQKDMLVHIQYQYHHLQVKIKYLHQQQVLLVYQYHHMNHKMVYVVLHIHVH